MYQREAIHEYQEPKRTWGEFKGLKCAEAEGNAWVTAESSWPHNIRVNLQIETFLKSNDSAASELLLASRPWPGPEVHGGSDDGLEVWLRELVPIELMPSS